MTELIILASMPQESGLTYLAKSSMQYLLGVLWTLREE